MDATRAWTACLAMAGLLGASVAARAAPHFLTPAEGVVGTMVAIDELPFDPTKRAKVRLVPRPDQAGLRPVALRLNWVRPAGLVATIVKGRAGVYDVVVTPGRRHVAPVTLADPFAILAPSVASVDPLIGGVGTTLHVRGAGFGAHPSSVRTWRRDGVTVGGRPVEIVSWTEDDITCVLPDTLFAGKQPVVVRTATGASVEPVPLIVTPPGDSPEFLRADMGGLPFQMTDRTAVWFTATIDAAQTQIVLTGFPGASRFVVVVVRPRLERATPFVVTAKADAAGTFFGAGYEDVVTGGVLSTAYGQDARLTITSWSDGVLEGSFEGTMGDGRGASVPVTGQFRVRLDVSLL